MFAALGLSATFVPVGFTVETRLRSSRKRRRRVDQTSDSCCNALPGRIAILPGRYRFRVSRKALQPGERSRRPIARAQYDRYNGDIAL